MHVMHEFVPSNRTSCCLPLCYHCCKLNIIQLTSHQCRLQAASAEDMQNMNHPFPTTCAVLLAPTQPNICCTSPFDLR